MLPARLTLYPARGGHLEKWVAGNAVDWNSRKDDPVVAVADGKVVGFREDSRVGGCSEQYKDDANFVAIEIAPNQVVRYMHLAPGSVTGAGIKLDGVHDKVEAGQVIGRVGLTGWVCGAHLHIVLEKQCSRHLCSAPLNFHEFKGKGPQKGVPYTSENWTRQQRLELAEEVRKKKEQAEITLIGEAIAKFHVVFECGTSSDCKKDIRKMPEAAWMTENAIRKLPKMLAPCPTDCGIWDGNRINPDDNVLQPFSAPTTDKIDVAAKEIWHSVNGDDRVTQYTVVKHSLVKDKETNRWKVDDWDVLCGYQINDATGEIIEGSEKNLEGCLWQPPGVGSW